MKKLYMMTVILFAGMILLPVFFFNLEPNSVSEIDNRTLTENPFTLDGDLTENIENYVNDRVGFRDEMITAYTVLNDQLFGKMVHPSYQYGKDGYVFGAGITTTNSFGEFHLAFADMVAEIQKYCEDRGVTFLFVFNPAKPAVYPDKLAEGICYNREWVSDFFDALDARGVTYLDNTETMVSLREQGIVGYNQKYDANHWNDTGAFYGTKRILEKLSELRSDIHINTEEEFEIGEKLESSLLVSKFPIHEYVPEYSLRTTLTSRYSEYFGELELHPKHQNFGYYVNSSQSVADTPKTLVFQGSFMNTRGYKFMANAFREYIHVHDYENVIDFPYYFNIFQPECVIFEVAEYTLSTTYFNLANMKAIAYQPTWSSVDGEVQILDSAELDLQVEKGQTLTTIRWNTDVPYTYVWLDLEDSYDMESVEGGYVLTLETARYEAGQSNLTLRVLE